MGTVEAGHCVALDLASERQHVVSFGGEFDVMDIYEALDSTGLIWALEMTFELRAKLLDLDVLCGTSGLVDILRVDRPVS